jgi:hypothetical protein
MVACAQHGWAGIEVDHLGGVRKLIILITDFLLETITLIDSKQINTSFK